MSQPKKQILALGGGGFSMEPDNLLLDRYILAQSRKDRPKVCFVPTASGDAKLYVDRFYASFNTLPCEPSHLSLFEPPTADLRSFVLDKDVVYVGGGNTKSLLALWREWRLDGVFREAWEAGVVLAGISAGSLCWFEEGITDSIPGPLTPIRCLGFLPGSNCPHYDGEAERRPSYHRLIAHGTIQGGLAAEDGVALHFVDTELTKVVSSRPNARGYRVRRAGERVVEEVLQPVFLGAYSP